MQQDSWSNAGDPVALEAEKLFCNLRHPSIAAIALSDGVAEPKATKAPQF
jgi:hypothetical protein